MPETFLLEVATPEQLLVHGEASEAQIPASTGYLGILPGHAALVSELGSGVLSYTMDGHRRSLRIEGGWFEISENHARVLASSAEQPNEE